MTALRVMKVFDCQEMPKEIRRAFLDTWDNKCNDVFVEWDTGEMDPEGPVTAWLLANGAEKDEEVLVQHWW